MRFKIYYRTQRCALEKKVSYTRQLKIMNSMNNEYLEK